MFFLIAILFFTGCTLVLGNVALSNDRGLILNRIIELSKENATIFYWCVTAGSGLLVATGLLGLISGLTSKKEIVLSENGISAPRSGISKKIISVKYSDITELTMQAVQKQRFLNIIHPGGKLTIPQSMLPNKQAFEDLVKIVSKRTNP